MEEDEKEENLVRSILGIDKDEEKAIMRELMHFAYDARIDGLSDIQMIVKIFPNLSKDDKLRIFYLAHMLHEGIYKHKRWFRK